MLAQVNIGSEFNSPFGQSVGINSLVSTILNASLVIAGVLMLFFFVIGGIQMIASAGSSNPEGAEKAKKAATSALVGFVVIFVAYWIIRVIEEITGIKFVTQPNL